MSSAVQLIGHHYVVVLFALYVLAVLVVRFVRRPVRAERAASWPVTEGTIQSVGRVVVEEGRSSYSVDVGDFSYSVNHEYYSGRLTISRSFSTHDASPKDLIAQKIQVRYNQRKPEQYSVPQTELGGFLLDPYDEPFGKDVGPIDLNINKI
jgi:hypothetical protein